MNITQHAKIKKEKKYSLRTILTEKSFECGDGINW